MTTSLADMLISGLLYLQQTGQLTPDVLRASNVTPEVIRQYWPQLSAASGLNTQLLGQYAGMQSEPPVEPARPPTQPSTPPVPPGQPPAPPSVPPAPPAPPPSSPWVPPVGPVPPPRPGWTQWGARQRGEPTWGTVAPIPTPTWGAPPGWFNWQARTTDPVAMALFVHNWLMAGLDPASQQAVGRYLARQKPEVFGAAGYGPGSSGFFGQELANPFWNPPPGYDRQRLQRLISEGYFDVNRFAENIGLSRETVIPKWGPMSWLLDYVKTAIGGLPSDWRQVSRAQRLDALRRLNTLATEAQASQTLQPYASLAEQLVNPVLRRGRLSGGVGQSRAVASPFGEAIRGSYRNPWAT